MATARATAPCSFYNGPDPVSFEEGDLITGDLAFLVISLGTLPFVACDDAGNPLVPQADVAQTATDEAVTAEVTA